MRETPASSVRLGLIADDLTGACDTGAQFVRHGLRTVVLLDAADVSPVEADLLVISTNSRGDTPEEAHRKTQRACLALQQQGARLLYKKIDSTLRGNIGSEITATLIAGGHPFAVIAPAFPAMGRRLLEGRLHMEGSAEFASLHLPTLLKEQGILSTAQLSVLEVRSGPAFLAEMLRMYGEQGVEAVIVDTEQEEDLACLAEAVLSCTPAPLPVGSAGLARHMAAHPSVRRTTPPASFLPASAVERQRPSPALLFLGTRSLVTKAQVSALRARGGTEVVNLDADAAEAVGVALRAGRQVVVPILWQGAEEERRLRAVLSHLKQVSVSGLVLSGGDTAALVCGLLGAWGLRLEGEVATGLPWGRLLGGEAQGMVVCTKAGGFGTEATLIAAVDFLARAGASVNENAQEKPT